MADGPFVEKDIWEYLSDRYPGQVQVLGPDVMNSGAGGNTLHQFWVITGEPSFPLLRDCADGSALSDTNLLRPYTQRDNYIVINKKGIVRYNADDAWDYGNRYHPDEILGVVDSLVTHTDDVGGGPASRWSLALAPNPTRGLLVLELANPTAAPVPARVSVVDVSGREVAELPPVDAHAGTTRLFWDGRGGRGERLSPGLYLVRAELAGRRIVRRVALTR